jgi:hypothetical protein
LAFYVPYFGLGVYAYSRKWFTSGVDFGRPWVWGLICFTLMVVNMLVGRSMTRVAELSLGLQLAFVVLYPFWTFSFLGMFTVLHLDVGTMPHHLARNYPPTLTICTWCIMCLL